MDKYIVLYGDKKKEDNICITNMFENTREINLGWTDFDYKNNIKIIDDEQDTEIMYFYGQEFYKTKLDINQYIEKIQSVTKQDVLNIAQNIKIDTIYFLNDKK